MESSGFASGPLLHFLGIAMVRRPQVTIVSGEPGSGKTTYVNQHAERGDLIWDMDTVGAAMGFPTYPRPNDIAKVLLHMRQQLLRMLLSKQVYRNAWIIIANPDDAQDYARALDAKWVHRLSPQAEGPPAT